METALATIDGKPDGIPVYKAGKDWKGAILTAYLTRRTLAGCMQPDVEQRRSSAKTIVFVARKTGRKTVVPLHPELETYLISLPSPDNGQASLFPALAGKETGGKFGLSMTFARIMARAKIAGEVLPRAQRQERPHGKQPLVPLAPAQLQLRNGECWRQPRGPHEAHRPRRQRHQYRLYPSRIRTTAKGNRGDPGTLSRDQKE